MAKQVVFALRNFISTVLNIIMIRDFSQGDSEEEITNKVLKAELTTLDLKKTGKKILCTEITGY